MMTFSDILDAAGNLSMEEQETLLTILQKRIAEKNREQLALDIQEARAEFSNSAAHPASVKEMMDEVRGEA